MTDDRVAVLLDQASEAVRSALHVSTPAAYPSHLYDRCSAVVDLLGRLKQVATGLHDTTERAPQTWNLGSDDETPASDHVDVACSALVRAAAEIDDAYRLAHESFSALSHLKIIE